MAESTNQIANRRGETGNMGNSANTASAGDSGFDASSVGELDENKSGKRPMIGDFRPAG
jgi:hypothetical protein